MIKMQPTAQTWFTGGPRNDLQKAPSSLLADWNAYASSKASVNAAESSSGIGFDLESAVKPANNKVNGIFNGVARGMKGLPISFQPSASRDPSGKSLLYFFVFLATGMFFIIVSFSVFLPVIVLTPQKFALSFTLGCAFIVGSFFALKGPKNQLLHMSSKERLPFTLGFVGSTVGTIYVSMVLHSYILSIFFSVLQVIALSYYGISYFPGGSAGIKLFCSILTSSFIKCFGR